MVRYIFTTGREEVQIYISRAMLLQIVIGSYLFFDSGLKKIVVFTILVAWDIC